MALVRSTSDAGLILESAPDELRTSEDGDAVTWHLRKVIVQGQQDLKQTDRKMVFVFGCS